LVTCSQSVAEIRLLSWPLAAPTLCIPPKSFARALAHARTRAHTYIHTRHLLDIIGLLSRDAEGCEKLRDVRAMPVVLGCLWEEDTDVVLRTGKVAATLAQHPPGLSLLFSSNALQRITEALEDQRLHIRCVTLGGPAANLSMRAYARLERPGSSSAKVKD
jgi:hypothetical protein